MRVHRARQKNTHIMRYDFLDDLLYSKESRGGEKTVQKNVKDSWKDIKENK